MTDNEKLTNLKTLLSDGGALPSDAKLTTYLSLASTEIVNWLYSNYPEGPTSSRLPAKYDVVQIYAVIAGFTHAGAEGESIHNENGVQHAFIYSDMVDYIHKNVFALAYVGAGDS